MFNSTMPEIYFSWDGRRKKLQSWHVIIYNDIYHILSIFIMETNQIIKISKSMHARIQFFPILTGSEL